MKNLAAVLHGVNDIRLEEIEVPEVGSEDILVNIKHVGICGTDLHFYKEGYIADNFKLSDPIIMGHEAVGIVESVGCKVESLKEGDQVVLEPGIPCIQCQSCRIGRYNLCSNMKFFSVPPYHGFLKNYHVHPAAYAYRIPKEVNLEEATLVEPLAVAIHSCNLLTISPGQNVLISGAGCLGLLHLMMAKIYGANYVVCTDIDEGRLNQARDMGADHCVTIAGKESAKELAHWIRSEQQDKSIDIAIDCTGVEQAIQTAIYAVKPGGKIALVGMAAHDLMDIPIITASIKELQIMGVRRYANCFHLALELIRTKRIQVAPLITHRFPMEAVGEALDVASSHSQNAMKVIINI